MNARTTLLAAPPRLLAAPSRHPDELKRFAMKRRGAPLLVATAGRQGNLSRSAGPRRRGFPGPASAPTAAPHPAFPHPASPHSTPVPTPAHSTPRAIRVRRSPR
ncbi:hypothetical protein ACFY0F_32665 [Streptomyces sp. NPDC001544]|uniref:hypothetical protein n=1 Tax=Streptomyces sp. NPDC001544 TaxID=3364584 RepID=UPI0036AE43D4